MTRPYKFPLIQFITALAITAVVSVWLGVQLAPSISAHSKPITAQPLSALPATNQDTEKLIVTLQERINLLQNENQRLSSQLQNQALAKVSPQPEPVAITADTAQLKEKIDSLEMEKQQRKASDVNAWIMNKQKADKQFDLSDELSRRFEQESVDPVWAEKEESHYRQLFSSKDSFRNFALRDTQCRSTQCEVTFSTSNSEQSFQLLQTISTELQGSEVLIATDETHGTSKLYINSQKGFELH